MRGRAVVVGLLVLSVGSFGPAPAGADHGSAGVAGRVTGPNAEPLAGICVEVYGEQDYVVVTTDQAGGYRADGLFPGEHLVGFNTCPEATPGHAGEFFDDAAGFSSATPVLIGEGQTRSGIDAALEPAAMISGTVVDEDGGTALAGDCVVAFEQLQGILGFARTGTDGSYTIGNLRGGEYLVAFADCSEAFTHVFELYDGSPLELPPLGSGVPQPGPAAVELEDGQSVDGIDESLAQGGSVVGSVTARHTGRLVDFVCVGLYAPASDAGAPDGLTITGFRPDDRPSPGNFVFGGVEPGDYAVGFNPEVCGDDGYDSSWALGKGAREDADVITVRKGEVSTGIGAVVSPRPSISVVCPADRPTGFRDVPDDNVHADAIGCIADAGIALGPGDGTYRPAEPVRRGQMATFIAATLEVLGVELPEDPPDTFTDDDGSVHEYAIAQLAASGIVGGKDFGRYAPDDPVSRAQMTAFLVRAYSRATGESLLEVDDVYADDDRTTHEGTINRAAAAGLTAGTASGAFGPAMDVRRDQMATFVARLLDRVVRDDVFYTSSPTTTTAEAEAGPGSGQLRNAPIDRLAQRMPQLAPLLDQVDRVSPALGQGRLRS